MKALFADYRLIWQAALRPSGLRRFLWWMQALLVPGFLIPIVMADRCPAALAFLPAAPAAVLLVLYWTVLVPGAALQNSPANACLVPRLRLRAMQLTAACWLLATASFALALGAAGGHGWLWALAIGLWLIGLGMAQAGRWGGAVLQLAPILASLFADSLPALKALVVSGSAPIVGLPLLLTVGAYALRAVFPRGGDRHYTQRIAQQQAMAPASARRDDKALLWLAGHSGWYAAILRRNCRRGAAASTMLLHALGPGAHWSASILPLLVVLALALLGKIALLAFAGAGTREAIADIGWIVLLPLMMLYMTGGQRFALRIGATTGEQAVLRMVPLVASLPRFNATLGKGLVRSVLLDWGLVTVAIMCLVLMTGAGRMVLFIAFLLCCLALPFAATVLRDYARDTRPRVLYVVAWMMVAVVSAAGIGVTALRTHSLLLCAAVPLASMALAGCTFALRWRRMAQAPIAFPAGRLAR